MPRIMGLLPLLLAGCGALGSSHGGGLVTGQSPSSNLATGGSQEGLQPPNSLPKGAEGIGTSPRPRFR